MEQVVFRCLLIIKASRVIRNECAYHCLCRFLSKIKRITGSSIPAMSLVCRLEIMHLNLLYNKATLSQCSTNHLLSLGLLFYTIFKSSGNCDFYLTYGPNNEKCICIFLSNECGTKAVNISPTAPEERNLDHCLHRAS